MNFFKGLDIIHANNYSCPKNMKNVKVMYTLYDLSFLEHPKFSIIAEAIYLLVENSGYRQKLKNLTLRQAQKFSWQRCASEVIEIYNHVKTLSKR